jgi:hypothetical protein
MSNEADTNRGSGWMAKTTAIIASIGALISIPVSIKSCHTATVAQRLNIIGAEVQWQSLLDGYNEVDGQVLEFENSRRIGREGPEVKEQSELDEHLRSLGFPPEIARLYRKRLQKYESLRNASEQYTPFQNRLSGVDFKLPRAPRLPSTTTFSGGSFSGGGSMR